MDEPSPFIRSVTCSRCRQKQTVRTDGQFNIRFMHAQSVRCINCLTVFEVFLPHQIVSGPSPAE
jgi:hypothetical protein